MLSFVLTDINDRKYTLYRPLSVSLLSSADAPADSLRAVFLVDKTDEPLYLVEALDDNECVFFGEIDSEIHSLSDKGTLLTLTARSRAAVLLDNEAYPQKYCSPSMPLLMQRHFIPLGFSKFVGSADAFSGELDITKGMSEWEVLESFCKRFLNTSPKITRDGVIDISGSESSEAIFLNTDSCLSVNRSIFRSSLMSELRLRARRSGGYEYPIYSALAEKQRVRRRRFMNTADNGRSVNDAKTLTEVSERRYRKTEILINGRLPAELGTRLFLDGADTGESIREIRYTLDSKGERTLIVTEGTAECN